MLNRHRTRATGADAAHASNAAPLLAAHGLTRTYATGDTEAPVTALRSVDLTLQAGEFVAIMGPSGCGKSTLLHLLGGLDRPTGGEILLRERRVDGLKEAQWARLRRTEIGVVFQFFNLIANLSVADNVELPALLAGVSPGEARQRREELLARLGLDERAGLVPGRLSGGQQQRVAIARALVNRPTLLLADEPTGNLDSVAAREVLTLLQEVHAAGQAILLVTHDARVASMADRIITMRDGAIIDDTSLSPMQSDGTGRTAAATPFTLASTHSDDTDTPDPAGRPSLRTRSGTATGKRDGAALVATRSGHPFGYGGRS